MSGSKRSGDDSWVAGRGEIDRSARSTPGGRGWSTATDPDQEEEDQRPSNPPRQLLRPSRRSTPTSATPARSGSDKESWRKKPVSPDPSLTREGSDSPTPTPFRTSGSSDSDSLLAASTAAAMRGSKRCGDDSWRSGRGGIGGNGRNTPGGRGWSPPWPASAPTPPAIGRRVYPSLANDSIVSIEQEDERFASPPHQLPLSPSPTRAGSSRWTSSTSGTTGRRGSESESWRKPEAPVLSHTHVGSTSPNPLLGTSVVHGWRKPLATPSPSRSDCESWKKELTSPSPSSSTSTWSNQLTTPSPTRSDSLSWRDLFTAFDFSRKIFTGEWPPSGRPLPDQFHLQLTPGILGRAPSCLILLEPHIPLTQEPSASQQPLLQQSSPEQVDPSCSTTRPGSTGALSGHSAPSQPSADQSFTVTMHQSSPGQDNTIHAATPGTSVEILAKWKSKFVEFLEEFQDSTHQSPFYKAYLIMLDKLDSFDFNIDFNHLMSWDRNLACIICNGQGRDDKWLRQAATMFMNHNGLAKQAGKVSFINMPTSLKSGREVFSTPDKLVIPVALFKSKESALMPTFHCAQLLRAMIRGLLDRLRTGVSWCGKLTVEDLEFREVAGILQVLIRRDPEVDEYAFGEEQVLDVRSLWPMIEAVVTWKGQLPLYFEELKIDLLGATAEDVDQEWFDEYLIYHSSLMSSLARRDFESGLYQVVNYWHLDQSLEFKALFEDAPMDGDWRDLVRGNHYLKVNFEYAKHLAVRQGKAKVVEDSTAKVPAVDCEKELFATGEVDKENMVKNAVKLEDDHHANSMWGLLEFRRHVNQHPRVGLDDIDESEVFLATLCSVFLPKLIKDLLRKCGMSLKFAGVWSAYKARKSDPMRLPEDVRASCGF